MGQCSREPSRSRASGVAAAMGSSSPGGDRRRPASASFPPVLPRTGHSLRTRTWSCSVPEHLLSAPSTCDAAAAGRPTGTGTGLWIPAPGRRDGTTHSNRNPNATTALATPQFVLDVGRSSVRSVTEAICRQFISGGPSRPSRPSRVVRRCVGFFISSTLRFASKRPGGFG